MQREPSMEEILASIRRIIEDNDTAQKETAPEPANTSAVSSSEIASFRAELRPAADFSTDSADSQESTAEEEAADLRPNTWADRQEDADDSDDPATEQRPDEGARMEPSGNADGARAGFEVLESAAPAPQSIAADRERTSRVADSAEAKPDALSFLRPAILSERTGRQVASSFRELNETLEANRRKSLDQMAEEMLQPMLQEWLDNNLPQLVERLVREEIERIARGT